MLFQKRPAAMLEEPFSRFPNTVTRDQDVRTAGSEHKKSGARDARDQESGVLDCGVVDTRIAVPGVEDARAAAEGKCGAGVEVAPVAESRVLPAGIATACGVVAAAAGVAGSHVQEARAGPGPGPRAEDSGVETGGDIARVSEPRIDVAGVEKTAVDVCGITEAGVRIAGVEAAAVEFPESKKPKLPALASSGVFVFPAFQEPVPTSPGSPKAKVPMSELAKPRFPVPEFDEADIPGGGVAHADIASARVRVSGVATNEVGHTMVATAEVRTPESTATSF